MQVLKFRPLWLVVGYCLVVFVIYSSLTTSPVTVDIEMSDKVMHVMAYFVLMGWFVQIYHNRRSHIILAVVFIALGIGMEFLQGAGGQRHFEVADMLANSTGVILAWLLTKTAFVSLLYHVENRFVVPAMNKFN